jgi:hypothetical protein
MAQTAGDREEYPWYKVVEGDGLLQGDFLDRCPVLVPRDPLSLTRTGANQTIDARVLVYDVVVMSQSCDLEQEKLDLVLVCPHWSLEEFGGANDYFKSTDGKEQLRRGNVPGYHLVASCDIEDWKRGIRVVDFRTVFALPFEFLKQFVAEKPIRLRLLPPYREHLSQAFARFFMRVGLPAEIPPFKK